VGGWISKREKANETEKFFERRGKIPPKNRRRGIRKTPAVISNGLNATTL